MTIIATINLEGLDEINDMFSRISEVPFDVTSEAISQMATVAMGAVRRTGQSMGVYDGASNVHILDQITKTRVKKTSGGGSCDVTFSGSRTRGNTTTRNAEIAFVNEYGKRGQQARPFIKQACEQYADQIASPGEKIIGDWFEKNI